MQNRLDVTKLHEHDKHGYGPFRAAGLGFGVDIDDFLAVPSSIVLVLAVQPALLPSCGSFPQKRSVHPFGAENGYNTSS